MKAVTSGQNRRESGSRKEAGNPPDSPIPTPGSRRPALEDDAEADPRRERREDRRRLQELQARRARDRFRRVAVGHVEHIEIRAQAEARA